MSQQQDQGSWPIPSQQLGIGDPPPFFTPPGINPKNPRINPKKEKDPSASLTLFRTANFFVHAFASHLRAGSFAKASTEGSLLERIRWTSTEKQRLLAAETRLLPRIDTLNAAQWREIPIPGWLEGMVVALILGALLTFQALNVFHAPYTSDEGTLMANAQAILQGKITPYLYDYSQPPLGWIQIAGWARLTGGIASFGNAINSGRVLMFILAITSSLLLYLIANRLSGSRSAALLAMILYTLSPLSLLYRDQVLLYNIGMFWLLLSLWLVTNGKSKLGTFALAAAALGIAILSEGWLLIFLPAMLYAVSLHATSFQRKFSLVTFVYITLAVSSVYVLLALLQNQFLPSGNPTTHPSLLGAFLFKTQTPLADQQARAIWQSWLQTDHLPFVPVEAFPIRLPFIPVANIPIHLSFIRLENLPDQLLYISTGTIALGTIAMFFNVLGGTVNRFQLLAALLGATFWVALIINNVWYPYSLVPLLPFLSLNIAMAINTPLRWLTRHIGFDLVRVFLFFIMLGILVPSAIQYAQPLLAPDGSQAQQQAMTWVRDNVPHNAVIITNSYMYADLLDPQGMAVGGGTPFTKAQIYTHAALDPSIAQGQLKENWQNIGFLVVDARMLKDIRTDRRFILLNEAIHHATLRVSFGNSQDGTQIRIYQVI
jgi:4-amino-4-deoxy-L-arabinose transferase-like glycosyltransferase